MKYFLDTEFIESGRLKPLTLISIGIVSEDGEEFYAVSNEFEPHDCSDWVKENVLPHLEGQRTRTVDEISRGVLSFIERSGENPQFYGYYSDYDWVLFCQMFGTMLDLPKGWPKYCLDIKQMSVELGNIKLPEQESGAQYLMPFKEGLDWKDFCKVWNRWDENHLLDLELLEIVTEK